MPKQVVTDTDRPIFDLGIEEGKRQGRKEMLDFLETKYLNKELDATSPEASAILKVARESSEFIRSKQDKKK